MSYYSDRSLSRTADDAEQDRRDGITPDAPFFTCAHCGGGEHVASTLQPAFCTECVYAIQQGRGDARKDLRRQPSWQCCTCDETDLAQRRTDDHPELCLSCPVRTAERQHTDRYIVVVSTVDGEPYSWRYTRTEAGEQRAAMKLAELARQGYVIADPLAAEAAAAAEEVQPF